MIAEEQARALSAGLSFCAKWRQSLDPVAFAVEALSIIPEPWQAEVLRSREKRFLLNCTRQGGKSTVAAILALHIALFRPDSLVLIISPSGRQSAELFDKIYKLFCRIPDRPRLVTDNVLSMELPNRSRIIALPDSEDKIRGYSDADLIVEDESARVPDETHDAVQPMLIVSDGRYLELSTPKGKKGHFYRHWADEHSGYRKIKVTIDETPHISEAKRADMLRELGTRMYQQECMCEFLDVAGAGIFRREWFEIVDSCPAEARQVRRWDLAATAGGGDATAGVRLAEHKGIFYIVDVRHLRGTPGQVEALVGQTAQLDGAHVRVRMEQEPGSAGLNTIDHYRRNILKGYDFKGVPSTGDKTMRAGPVSAAAEAGNVKIVRGAWDISGFLDELVSFPDGDHDDRVDALSGAFGDIRRSAEPRIIGL